MAELTKQALKVDNNQSFPNNNAGAITPAILRDFNTDMIDSLVDEVSYNADSASWNSDIASIEFALSSSVTVSTGSLLTTASFSGNTMTFTKGDGSTFGVVIPDVSGSTTTALNQATASLQAFTASVAGTNTFTQSAQLEINSLEAFTSSIAGTNTFTASIAGTNAFTQSAQQSINALNSASSSYAISSSVAAVDAAQQAQINSLIASTGSAANLTALNAFTASIFGTNDFTASIKNTNTFTASAQLEINALESFTASVAGTNTFTQSAQVSITALNAATSSYAKTNVDNRFTTGQTITGSLVVTGTITANELHVIIESSSVIYSSGSNQFGDALNDTQILSGSTKIVGTAELNGSPLVTSAETASYIQDLGPLNAFSASTNTFTQSADLRLDALENVTASYATTGSNVFIGNQTISGSLFISGSEVVAGPVTASKLQINGITDLNGTLDVSNDATFRGDVLIQSSGEQKFKMRSTSGGGVSQGFDLLIQTSSFIIRDETHNIDFFEFDYNASNGDHILRLEANRFEMNSGSLGVSGSLTASLQEGYVWVGNSSGVTQAIPTSSFAENTDLGPLNAFSASTNLFTQSAQLQINSLEAFSASALITASATLNTLTFTKGNGSTFAVTVDTGSGAGGAAFPFTGSALITGSLVVTGSIASQATTLGTSNAVLINANASTPIRISDRSTGDSAAIIISGSQIASRQNQIQIQNINRGRFVMGSSFAGGTNDRTVFNIEYRGTERNAINGYVGTSVGFDYQDANTSDANAIYISASRGSDSLRNFMGFNARPNEYAGSIYNYVFAPANGSLGGMRMGIFGHLFVTESFTASLQNGFAWVGDGNGYSRAVATSSFAGTAVDISALNAFSASTNLFTQSAQLEINALEGFTASIAGTNAFTASATLRLNSIESMTGSYATTGSNTFVGNQFITGALQVSSAAIYDIDVTGSIQATTSMRVTGSNGVGLLQNNLLSITSGSYSSLINRGAIINQLSLAGNQKYISMAADPSGLGAIFPTLAGVTSPSIISQGPAGTSYYAPIRLQSSASYTDGRVTITTPLEALSGSIISGSTQLVGTATLNGNTLLTSAETASLLITASFSGNTLTFTKGDSTTFGVTIPDVSGSTINTGSFATTGSNAFFGNQTISGSVGISGSAITFVSGTLSGSTITNIGDTFTDVAPVNRIITLTSASYAALVTGSTTDPNALYIVSGSTSGSITGAGLNGNTFSGSQVITGSVQGNVVAMSIASNTASMDFNAGNFFTLTLESGSIPTFINPTNIKAGQTISLVVTQAATLSGSLAFPTTFKFPSGSSYVPSAVTSSKDIVTFITVDTSTIFASSVKNLI
jgi:hypothetical protein